MSNPAIDADIAAQLAIALGVNTTAVTISVTDTGAQFRSSQNDTSDPGVVAHKFSITTKSDALITAIVDALVLEGRP